MVNYKLMIGLILTLALVVGCAFSNSDSQIVPAIPPPAMHSLELVPDQIFQETGYLADQQGFIGDQIGATVDSVVIDELTQIKTISISVPVDPNTVDKLEVVDRNNRPITHLGEPKIIRDYENNNVGVKLYVSPKRNFEFKLKLSSENNGNH